LWAEHLCGSFPLPISYTREQSSFLRILPLSSRPYLLNYPADRSYRPRNVCIWHLLCYPFPSKDSFSHYTWFLSYERHLVNVSYKKHSTFHQKSTNVVCFTRPLTFFEFAFSFDLASAIFCIYFLLKIFILPIYYFPKPSSSLLQRKSSLDRLSSTQLPILRWQPIRSNHLPSLTPHRRRRPKQPPRISLLLNLQQLLALISRKALLPIRLRHISFINVRTGPWRRSPNDIHLAIRHRIVIKNRLGWPSKRGRPEVKDICMHDRFSKRRVHTVVSWVSSNFFCWLHVDAVKSDPRFHGLANRGHGVIEEDAVFPIAIGKETACEARISWSITFTVAGGPPAVTNNESAEYL
jgi:hypothetical protein